MTDRSAQRPSAQCAAPRWQERLEQHQVALYLVALGVGAALGLLVPAVSAPATAAINPVLALLLYATFLGVPFARLGAALRDLRFLATVLAVNFIAVPLVVWGLSSIVEHDRALLVGALFVLLTPCIDYVIVFTGLAGGAADRLLAVSPMLMLAQIALLPVYLGLFVGGGFAASIDLAPFIEAFALLVAAPLLAAAATQWAASRRGVSGRGVPGRAARALQRGATAAMVPIMMLTLATVVASQIAAVGGRIASLLLVVPVYALFAAIIVPLGAVAARLARLDAAQGRAVVFSGVTRNSLVVLPLVLALPAAYDLAPLAVVTQTLVELVVMVICVRLVPRIVPGA